MYSQEEIKHWLDIANTTSNWRVCVADSALVIAMMMYNQQYGKKRRK